EAPVVHEEEPFSFSLRWHGSGGACGGCFEAARCGGREWAGCAACHVASVWGTTHGSLPCGVMRIGEGKCAAAAECAVDVDPPRPSRCGCVGALWGRLLLRVSFALARWVRILEWADNK
ncbi:hypothetical protein TraAM80_09596, partial [Trypanosoma rangeli]